MADSKITDLTLATSITGDDVLPIVNGGSTKKVTVTKIKEGLATTTYVDTQDALKYDASNPSGYQTAGQVQTIADAKVVQTITNGVTATAPSQDAVFDALATKQATLVSATNIKTINGTTILGSGDLVVSGGGGGATNLTTSQTVSNFTINSDTGTDASVPLGNGTLAGASLNNFSNTDKTKLNGLTQVEVINDPEITSIYNTFSSEYVDNAILNLSNNKLDKVILNAYSLLANNTNLAGILQPAAFRKWDLATYTLTPTWTGTTNPTVLLGNTYSGQQVGNMVSINIALVYSTAGAANTQVILPLPSDFPTPYSPTGLTGALDIIAYGTGMILASTTSTAVTGARNSLLRRNSANTGYEFLMNISVSVAAKVAILNITYQIS